MMKKSHQATLFVLGSLTVGSLSSCTNDLYAHDYLGLHGYPVTPMGIDETPQANAMAMPPPAPVAAPAPTPLVNHSIIDDRDDLPPPPPKKHPVETPDAS